MGLGDLFKKNGIDEGSVSEEDSEEVARDLVRLLGGVEENPLVSNEEMDDSEIAESLSGTYLKDTSELLEIADEIEARREVLEPIPDHILNGDNEEVVFSGSYFYSKYLQKEVEIKKQWQQEIESMSVSELFDVIKNRYANSTPQELFIVGDSMKNQMCQYAEKELCERAKKAASRKTCYHILGELLCRSFNTNNSFVGSKYGECDDLVEWIRERYVYLYANLAETNFKTECQSALDMIDLDSTLEEKLKARYVSLEKKHKTHEKKKDLKIEEQMLSFLSHIVFSDSSYSCAENHTFVTSWVQQPKEEWIKETKEKINRKYKSDKSFV